MSRSCNVTGFYRLGYDRSTVTKEDAAELCLYVRVILGGGGKFEAILLSFAPSRRSESRWVRAKFETWARDLSSYFEDTEYAFSRPTGRDE